LLNRSASASIKGYFYQFDHTILQLLEASSGNASVVVEGIEDIDVSNGDGDVLVQCKFYEGSDYKHSLIKDAVCHMLRHFHAAGYPANRRIKYRLYGYYKGGKEKLPGTVDVDFLKKNFLTYHRQDETQEVHVELGSTDAQLARFIELLEIDLGARSYEAQQQKILKLLQAQIHGCDSQDAGVFYYPNAIHTIQSLAVKAEVSQRTITKAAFIAAVNRKEFVFSHWLQQRFGRERYARFIKRKHFTFPVTKLPKATRILIVDMTDEFDLVKATALLERLGTKLSHVEHPRTPPQDRFCPSILLRGLAPNDLSALKANLFKQGVRFVDGHPFKDSPFMIDHFAVVPTKEQLIRLRFMPDVDQLATATSSLGGAIVEVFDFFKDSAVPATRLPVGAPCHQFKIESAYFVGEVL
jgi:hypothetical protein